MPFRRGLDVHFIDGKVWRLNARLVYESNDGHLVISVPRGFITDFASIPRVLWSLVGDPAGPWAPAAVIHDYLYRTHQSSRPQADQLFYEAMGALRCDPLSRWLMWAALRLFGRFAWNRGPSARRDRL